MASTERAPPPRGERGTRIEPYLFVVLEGARLDAGGMRVSLSGVDPLRIGRGEARVLSGDALEIPDPRMSGAHARIDRNAAGALVAHRPGS